MKKGSSLDYLAEEPAANTRPRLVDTVHKSASFHSIRQLGVASSPPRSPSHSPLFSRRGGSEPPNHRALIHVGSPVHSPLLSQLGERPTSPLRKIPPAPLPKPNRSSPQPVRKKPQNNIYDEIKNVVSPEAASRSLGHYATPASVTVTKPLSIKQLVDGHRDKFPLVVRVTAGFLGTSEHDTFSEGDLLNIHFEKKAKMITLRYGGVRRVKVPVNSALQFGILYNPDNNITGAMTGYEFRSANQLMAMSPLPKLVCATESSKVGPVTADEVLLLREVVYSSASGIKYLVCTSMQTGMEKKIPENCLASFTTDPFKVKIYLSHIIKHFPLPVEAMVFVPYDYRDQGDDGPPFDHETVVTICTCQKEATLIASSCIQDEEPDSKELSCFDIPTDLPVMKVQVMRKSVQELNKLYQVTCDLYENYTLTPVTHTPIAPAGESSIYFLPVQKNRKTSAFQLVEPVAAYQGLKSLNKVVEEPASSILSSTDEPIYDVPPDSEQPEVVANIYQHPKSIPVQPMQATPQQNIYQVPRNIASPQEVEQPRRPSKGSSRYVPFTIGSRPQPPSSSPSSDATDATDSSPASSAPTKGELESLKHDFKNVLESNQRLNESVKGEFISQYGCNEIWYCYVNND